MTNRTVRTYEISLAAFISKKTEFDALHGELKLPNNDHFGADPEAVLLGETTWLSDATANLKDIADQHFRRGEYVLRREQVPQRPDRQRRRGSRQ